jgi:hypothetical protein
VTLAEFDAPKTGYLSFIPRCESGSEKKTISFGTLDANRV